MGTSSAMLPPQSQNYVLTAELLFPAEIMLAAWSRGRGRKIDYARIFNAQDRTVIYITECVSWAERLMGGKDGHSFSDCNV